MKSLAMKNRTTSYVRIILSLEIYYFLIVSKNLELFI